MTDAGQAQSDLLLDGGEALRRGAWGEARDHFEAAVQERETPQALEGLGMAAQWLVDQETVFVARERAYRLYRESNSPRDAARRSGNPRRSVHRSAIGNGDTPQRTARRRCQGGMAQARARAPR